MVGRWSISCFQSGTHIVTRNLPGRPHYYVYPPEGVDRYQVCEELRDWLNHEGPRPVWADNMRRDTRYPSRANHPDGRPIYATGPSLESAPGSGDWSLDMDPACVAEREHLIDVLLGESERTPGGGE